MRIATEQTLHRGRRLPGIAFLVLPLLFIHGVLRAGELRRYPLKYHLLYTDLGDEKVLEARARIEAMARGYHECTKGFGGRMPGKMPFYLFCSHADFQDSVSAGLRNFSGAYDGISLKVSADTDRYSWRKIWQVVRHEGFHQFVHWRLARGRGGRIPVWLNEGLAEYFGAARWTGDRLMTGFIPPLRKLKLLGHLYTGGIEPFPAFITKTGTQWVDEASPAHYDQAWSMVHFFAHAEEEKYKKSFGTYVKQVVRGMPNARAFVKSFDDDTGELEKAYCRWWKSLPAHPARDLYDRLVLERLVAFLARFYQKGVRFETAEDFFRRAGRGDVALDPDEDGDRWLPPALLEWAVRKAGVYENRRLAAGGNGYPVLVLERSDGKKLEGGFYLRGGTPVAIVNTDGDRTICAGP